MWEIIYTKKAQKDAKKIKESNLSAIVRKLLSVIENDPFTPPFEKLRRDLSGACSRRINIQHRLVYEVLKDSHTIKILSMWTHYE
jgi:Txe/YoeB family toxin of toxin-antitoxin system